MKINADLTIRAEVHAPDMEWVPSPEPGVLRRMLDRDGGEVVRSTTVVRFEPGAWFPEHTHGGGEEFLVLDGVFSDEDGDYTAGTYVRHTVGTSHSAWSDEGREILVKRMQMDPADSKKAVLDTDALDWQPGPETGVDIKPLHEFGDEKVMLMRILAGTRIARHRHEAGTELFVLDGTLADQDGTYGKGAWQCQPAGSVHEPFSEQGGFFYVKKGHFV